ncbi:MurR/RpiR family transcriptional regulator [Nesterenkonia flava]|uniref:MurR/RpiR family transcriptional regulator n=1 Tax=Nesterenkonia flava TaxID=469799 RepID=A0ABU1FQQ8_9MICC|nr:MurR/RpiR family transcriptional regulator [Nesterenkonia flava]MDR5710970.1 MurR/RpiR family transcriptional regulator [Nesterenkonia flava]
MSTTPPSPEDLPALTRITAALPSLLPSEAKAARYVLEDPAAAIDSTAQQMSEAVGVARSTIIRMCRRLGYPGYPQFRVALAREVPALSATPGEQQRRDRSSSLAGEARHILHGMDRALDGVTADQERRLIAALTAAQRLLVVANGQSVPSALDFSTRLTAAGRPAEYIHDTLSQQIAARQLRATDLCVVISASGMNSLSLQTARAAAESPGVVVVLTSNTESQLARLADLSIRVLPPVGSFREELEDTSRLHYTLAVESICRLVREHLGQRAETARALVFDVLSEVLVD